MHRLGRRLRRALARALAPVGASPGIHVVNGATLETTSATSVDSEGDAKILFVSMIPDRTAGSLAVAPLSNPRSQRAIAGLRCERVYYAGGHGLCLTRGGLLNTTYVAKVFDSSFHVERQITLPGIPSRARVSPDGRYGATTMFVKGDNYAAGNFSTRTSIFDLGTGKEVVNLEQLPVTRDGKPFSNRNFNFWGVTFARDDDHFYASLGSGSKTYLLAGSMRDRTLRVIDESVECPSLSPDGTKIAFKRVVGETGRLAAVRARPAHDARDPAGRRRPDRRPGGVAGRRPRRVRERQRACGRSRRTGPVTRGSCSPTPTRRPFPALPEQPAVPAVPSPR